MPYVAVTLRNRGGAILYPRIVPTPSADEMRRAMPEQKRDMRILWIPDELVKAVYTAEEVKRHDRTGQVLMPQAPQPYAAGAD